MDVRVEHVEGVCFRISARSHNILSDQPSDNGGNDRGMTPPELMLAALGSCAAFYAYQFFAVRNIPVAELRVAVSAEKLKAPSRLGGFRVEVDTDVLMDQDKKQALLKSIRQCMIHNTMLSQPVIEVALREQTVESEANKKTSSSSA